MSLKLFLAACIVAACIMMGQSMSLSTKLRCNQLEKAIEAIRALRIQITGVLAPTQSALLATDFPPFKAVAEKMGSDISASDAWREISTAKDDRFVNCLNKSEKNYLGQMFAHLGCSGRTAQDELLASCCDHLQVSLDDARVRSKEVSKLYTSLGFLLGLSIVILII